MSKFSDIEFGIATDNAICAICKDNVEINHKFARIKINNLSNPYLHADCLVGAAEFYKNLDVSTLEDKLNAKLEVRREKKLANSAKLNKLNWRKSIIKEAIKKSGLKGKYSLTGKTNYNWVAVWAGKTCLSHCGLTATFDGQTLNCRYNIYGRNSYQYTSDKLISYSLADPDFLKQLSNDFNKYL